MTHTWSHTLHLIAHHLTWRQKVQAIKIIREIWDAISLRNAPEEKFAN